MKENPYLSQMGCSHDRRKVIYFLVNSTFILIIWIKEREIFEKPT